jgi:uncharacterized protein YjiS (DUF1127 family)
MDLEEWLRSIGLDQYEPTFREHQIDGTILPSLTAEDLKDLGVSMVGHRRKLLDAIAFRAVTHQGRRYRFCRRKAQLSTTLLSDVKSRSCSRIWSGLPRFPRGWTRKRGDLCLPETC